MIHYEVDNACEKFVKCLATNETTSPLIDNHVASEIERQKNVLASDIKGLFKESLEKMGNILTEHFSIPPNVTLSTDQAKLKYNDSSEEKLREQYDELFKKFMMVSRMLLIVKRSVWL